MALSFENTAPPISVLMPVYNCETYVSEAVESILKQTFSDFEFIIIDDASTDNTLAIVQKFSDERIKIVRKRENTGYTNSLNIGLEMAKGKYIARMDGDDISLPLRFEKQLKFFEKHTGAIVCGTNYRFLNSDNISGHPSSPEKTKVYLLGGCYVAHPTVMFKKSALMDNHIQYNSEYEPAEDYNLWVALSSFGEIGNVEESLLFYRVHEHQVSQKKSERQQKYTDVARLSMLHYLIPKNEMTPRDIEIHLALMKGWGGKIRIREVKKWISELTTKNKDRKVFNEEYLEKFMAEKLHTLLCNQKKSRISFGKRVNWKLRAFAKDTLNLLKS